MSIYGNNEDSRPAAGGERRWDGPESCFAAGVSAGGGLGLHEIEQACCTSLLKIEPFFRTSFVVGKQRG